MGGGHKYFSFRTCQCNNEEKRSELDTSYLCIIECVATRASNSSSKFSRSNPSEQSSPISTIRKEFSSLIAQYGPVERWKTEGEEEITLKIAILYDIEIVKSYF